MTGDELDRICLLDVAASGEVIVTDTDIDELDEETPSVEADPADAVVVETHRGEAWLSFFEGSHCRVSHDTIAWLRMPPDWLLSHFRGRTICSLVDTDHVVVVVGRARLHPQEDGTRIGVESDDFTYRVSVYEGSARVETIGIEAQVLQAGQEIFCETVEDCQVFEGVEGPPEEDFFPPDD